MVAKGNAERPRNGGKRKCRVAKKWWQKGMERGQEMVAKGNGERPRTGNKKKKRVALIMLIIALQLDVSTSKLYEVAIWRLLYVSLVVCCDVMARLLTLFLLAGSLYRRNTRR